MSEDTTPHPAASTAKPEITSDQSARLMRMATYFAVGVASVLIVAKLSAWMITGSVSLLSTLIDSLLDVGASIINLLAVRHALQPADEEHRFGHGKAEPLAGLAQAAFISGSAVFLLIEASDRLFNPQAITHSAIGYGVMAGSIGLTAMLVVFQKYVVVRTGSVAIRADSVHYRMDVLVNAAVIVALFLSTQTGLGIADPIFALFIAAYILRGAWMVGSESYEMLMDRELPDDDRERIRVIALAHPSVRELHDMRTRMSGQHTFIQMHLEMDGDITLNEAHIISEEVMYNIEEAFPKAEVLIHEDPQGVDERRLDID